MSLIGRTRVSVLMEIEAHYAEADYDSHVVAAEQQVEDYDYGYGEEN
jgi:hypothetical protein